MSTATEERAVVESDVLVLKGDELLKLWKRGREVWNAWIQESPKAKVYFRGVSFPKDIEKPLEDFCLPRRRDVKELGPRINAAGALFAQTLNAKHAVALWKKGKDVWNKYSTQPEYQDYDVNFESVKFPDGNGGS